MYQSRRVIALVPAFNEAEKVGQVITRTDRDVVDCVLVIDDGSTDGTADVARARGADVLSHELRRGTGAALRSGMLFARREGYEIAVIMAGNNKDDPAEIPRLLAPICDQEYDFVIGSRFAEGGHCGGDMPLYRQLATRFHPWLMGRLARKHLTESTNGFRAFKLSILDDPRINLHQGWLDSYGLEVYFLWKVLTMGYRHTEVPCTKTYPPRSLGYTKMIPIVDWWKMLRPVLWLGLGLRQ